MVPRYFLTKWGDVYRFAKRTENNALFRQFSRYVVAYETESKNRIDGDPSLREPKSKAARRRLQPLYSKRYSRPFAVRLPAGKRSYRRAVSA